MRRMTLSGPAAAFTNVSLAVLYGLFAYAHLLSFIHCHRTSTVLIVVMEALLAMFILIRRPADKASFSAWDWLVTTVGSFATLLLRPILASQDILAGQVIQALGAALAVFGILSLNRSFGLLPAHREIKRSGMYRWVRHPLYASYFLIEVGYLISNFTLFNLLIVIAAFACAILRMLSEERFLSHYEAYSDYKVHTRWRLLPYVF